MNYVTITLQEKIGSCPHNVGDSWEVPYGMYHPSGLCHDAHYVLIPYISMSSAGGKSWESDGEWLIHCPSKKGVVFKLKRGVKQVKFPDGEYEILE